MTEASQKKRKWDLDDHGQDRSESSDPASKISKVEDKEFSRKTSDEKPKDPAKSAMDEATAKINAILAQKGITPEGDKYSSGKNDGEFVKDIPINDLKNRYMLTRGATQAQIQRETGADVTTRGKYYPDKNLATESDPPLYLHVTATTKESLDKAVAQIEDLIKNAQLPTQGTGFHGHERRERKIYEEKIYVNIESSPHFNLRAKIVGPHGAYVKHIQNETGSRVQLKGKGSGFYETSTGQESDEPLHVHITCTREEGLEKAVQLTEDLLKTVRAEHERMKQYPYYGRGYGRGYQNYGAYAAPPPLPPGQPGMGYPPPPPPPASSSQSASPATSAEAPRESTPNNTPYDSDPTATAAANATSAAATTATAAYSNPYDAYSQYYAYYGHYDPNYYSYYGYSAPAAAPGQTVQDPYQQQPPPAPQQPAEGSQSLPNAAAPPS